MAENGRVIVTGCFGVEDKRIRDAFPDVLAVTGPHQYDAVMSAIHAATPPRTRRSSICSARRAAAYAAAITPI